MKNLVNTIFLLIIIVLLSVVIFQLSKTNNDKIVVNTQKTTEETIPVVVPTPTPIPIATPNPVPTPKPSPIIPTCTTITEGIFAISDYENFKCGRTLKYTNVTEATNAFKAATHQNIMTNDSSILFYVPGKFPREDGNPYFFGRGTIDQEANQCVNGYMNLVTGMTEWHTDVCYILD